MSAGSLLSLGALHVSAEPCLPMPEQVKETSPHVVTPEC